MSPCLYRQKVWFDLLWTHGYPRPGGARVDWPLHSLGSGEQVLPLVRHGGHLQSLSSFYTPRFGPRRVAEDASLTLDQKACSRWLTEHAHAHSLRLQPFRKQDAWVPEIEQALRAAGFVCWRFESGVNWSQPVSAGQGFQPYWSARPSRLKNTVKRAQRKLARRGGSCIEILSEPGPALQDAIAAYESVYAQSWKGAEPCPQFMPSLLTLAASCGVLRLGLLRMDGEVVAAQVWLVHEGQADIYKLAQRPGFDAWSVGSVLSAALMAHVIDVDGVSAVDFLMGDDAYKSDWMTVRQPLWGLVAFRWRDPRSWPALLRHVAGVGLAAVRRLIRARPAGMSPTAKLSCAE